MIILDSTTKTLEILMSGAPATNQSPVVTSYVDVTTTSYVPGSRNTATNGSTAVKIAYAPGVSEMQRQIKLINVYNQDTAAIDVTIRLNDNATTRILCLVTLAVGSTLFYTDGEGWRVMSTAGVSL